jgi:hypothetical protein
LQSVARIGAALAWIGMLLPAAALDAAPPPTSRPATPPTIVDLELAADGSLHGVVINAHGVPLSRMAVVVRRGGQELWRGETDALGRFAVAGLRGGNYQLQAGGAMRHVRAWTARTAPPIASRVAVIRLADDVVRGQRPLGEALTSDGVVLVGIVGAMIAIPIAVHQANSRSPSSP